MTETEGISETLVSNSDLILLNVRDFSTKAILLTELVITMLQLCYTYVEETIHVLPNHLVIKKKTKRVATFNKPTMLIIRSAFVNMYKNDKRKLRQSRGPQIIILETLPEEFQISNDENILT
jgi:hypothetical protein